MAIMRTALITVVVICLASCTGASSVGQLLERDVSRDCDAVCDNTANAAECLDACFVQFAQEHNNVAYCKHVQQKHLRDGCHVDMALVLEEPSICADIEASALCYSMLAISLEDSELCEQIPPGLLQTSCYQRTAN